MTYLTHTLRDLTENASNKYPVSIPCLIFKNKYAHLEGLPNYIIDRDVLAQIVYELIKNVADNFIPIIISLKQHAINRMEGKGVYVLDSINDQFIYLFGAKDQRNFFSGLDNLRSNSKINTSLMISYLSNAVDCIQMSQMLVNKLNCLLDLHGNIYGKYVLLDKKEEIKFPLLNKNFKLNLLYGIVRNDELSI